MQVLCPSMDRVGKASIFQSHVSQPDQTLLCRMILSFWAHHVAHHQVVALLGTRQLGCLQYRSAEGLYAILLILPPCERSYCRRAALVIFQHHLRHHLRPVDLAVVFLLDVCERVALRQRLLLVCAAVLQLIFSFLQQLLLPFVFYLRLVLFFRTHRAFSSQLPRTCT